MTPPLLTFAPGSGVPVDVDRLIASRALIQANSGGGKSRALRYLLEQTHGRVQHLIIDPEGEFSTLRERFPYVLAGRDGDIPADPKTAKLLCRRLMEIGASAVIDLYELKLDDRRAFVRLFLEELMHLPRALWHPALVVIDEAHIFAPESGSGSSQSLEAVIALATQGRKRGYALVAATQRLSKLHKDVAAELLNKLIGRTGLDVDMKRAGDELGMGKDDRTTLRTLAPGTFYVYGPAIANAVTLVRTGDVVTTHPEAGALAAPPPPAPAAVAGLLAQLKDIPQAAAEELRSLDDYKRKNAALERELRQVKASGTVRDVEKVVVDQGAIDRAVAQALADQRYATTSRIADARARLETDLRSLSDLAGEVVHRIDHLDLTIPKEDAAPVIARIAAKPIVRTPAEHNRIAEAVRIRTNGNGRLGRGETAVLTAIAQYPDGASREQISVLTGYKRSSRDTYLQRLQAAGFAESNGDTIVATDAGVDALGPDFEPLPTGAALREYWLSRLGGGERMLLGALIDAHPEAVDRDALSETTGYKRSSRDTYLQRLGARKLITSVGRGAVRAADLLFETGRA